MKLSVIVPFSGGIKMLKDCLDSLSEQTYKDFEVVLVRDHDTEDVSALVAEYPALRINTVDSEGKGVAAARNTGIKNATGEYIYFIDADDFMYDGSEFEKLVALADAEGTDLIYGKKISTWFTRSGFQSTFDPVEAGLVDESKNEEGEEGGNELVNDDNDTEGDEELEPEAFEERERSRAVKYLITKRKGFKNISVLHILFRKSFIENAGLQFDEAGTYYVDVPFVAHALENAVKVRRIQDVYYVKRKHSDPINTPSLAQIQDENRFMDMLSSYEKAVEGLPEDSKARLHLDRKLIGYYTGYLALKIRRSENDEWRTTKFEAIRKVIDTIPKENKKHLKFHQRRLLKALHQGDAVKAYKAITAHLMVKRFFKLLRHPKTIRRVLYTHVFLKKPIKENVILFESFLGKNYSDSPKYIYEYLAKNYPGKYKFVWILDNKTKLPYEGTKISRRGFRYYYYLAVSKYFVFNMRQPVWFVKRDGMVFLETWHGTPLKKLVFDMDEVHSASPLYKKEVYNQSRAWDYLIAANGFSSKVFRSCFMYDNEMLEYGYPRNDLMHAPDRDQIGLDIRKKLGIPEGKKTILYAPTWRDDEFYDKGKYKFTLKLDLDMMRDQLGDEYVVLLRTHYFIADALDLTPYKGFAFNVCKYNDITELYLASDIIITDYSSVFFDYANLKRPMLFYTYDLEKYRDVLRGFYIDIEEELPGPLLFTTQEVIDSIKDIDGVTAKYADRYDVFYEKFCGWEDGNAAKNVCKRVFGVD